MRIYTNDNKIIIIDDNGNLNEYENNEEIIELIQSLNDLEYVSALKKDYKVELDDRKLKNIGIILSELGILVGITPPLALSMINDVSLLTNIVGMGLATVIVITGIVVYHKKKKKINDLQRKYDYIDNEELNINNKIEEISKKVKTKAFENKKNQNLIEFKRVSETLKDKLDYVLEDTNNNEKTKVYTLKPNKNK